MRNIETRIKNCELEREYARLSYPEFFAEINKQIDFFISLLRQEQENEDSSLSLEVGKTSF